MRLVLFFSLCFSISSVYSQIRLNIRPDMITDEKAFPQASPHRMFDEQQLITTEPPRTKPVTLWASYIDKDLFYPLSAVVDFGREIKISNIYIFDVGGQSNVSMYAKGATSWELLFKDPLTGYESWNKHAVNKLTRYIRITSDSPDGSFPEVVIYGDKQTQPPVYTPVPAMKYSNMEDFAGLNILHVNNIEYASIVKNVRQFHMWNWNEANTEIAGYPGYPNNKYGYNPSPVAHWDFDKVYKDYKDRGMKILPALQGSPYWLFNNINHEVSEWKPITGTESAENPASYIEHADYLYQFVARYGKVAVPASQLKVRSDNQVKSGLGTIESVENWNEPNKTWKARKGLFLPYEYAAMTSADYDGHQKKLGTNVGAKNADPDIPFVMAGLTGMDTVYLKAMIYWFKQNRTDFMNPFNIINFHHYSNDVGGQIGSPSFGVSPEADGLEKKVRDVVGFCHRNLINKPVWITEFGYDVNQTSPQRAKIYSSFLGEDVQAMWLVRSFMAMHAGGADRAYAFWLQDDDSINPELFGSCGIVKYYPPAKPVPRKAWYWLSTMNKVLGKYHFDSKVIDSKTHIYKFTTSLSQDTSIYCIWNGSADGTIRSNFKLTVNAAKAIMISPKEGSPAGTQTPIVVTNNQVSVNVTENPVYIKVYGKANVLGMEEITETQKLIELYPNPTNDNCTLTFPQGMKVKEITIFDAGGRIIKNIPSAEISPIVDINTSNLISGIYQVRVIADGQPPIVKKLVVTK